MIRKDYLKKLMDWMDSEPVKIITGIRRCGKSTLLKQLAAELIEANENNRVIYLNFEDISTLKYSNVESLNVMCMEVIEENRRENVELKTYFLFDEIQEVESWERLVRSLKLQENVDIVITGSNSHVLSSELSTLLSGRYIELFMLPFSYGEVIKYTNDDDLNKYIEFGGFPGVVKLKTDEEKNTLLNDLINSILYKDVLERNVVQDPNLLKNLFSFICDNIGSETSINNIYNKIRSSGIRTKAETIRKYLDALKDAYFIYEVQRYNIKGKELLVRNPKYYVADSGIIDKLKSPASQNIGSVIENIVFLELLRSGYEVYVGNIQNYEIDFIARKGGRLCYIQVAMSILDEKTAEREYRPLELIEDNYPKYIITNDELNLSRSGIVHLNLKNFLIEGADFL